MVKASRARAPMTINSQLIFVNRFPNDIVRPESIMREEPRETERDNLAAAELHALASH